MKKTSVMNQKGVAAIEFAFLLPFLLLLIFGIIEFSAVLYNKAMITNASREGARAGIFYTTQKTLTNEEITAVVQNYLDWGALLTHFGETSTVTVNVQGAQGPPGTDLIVDVEYQYHYLILPNFANRLTGPLTISAKTIMRMMQDDK